MEQSYCVVETKTHGIGNGQIVCITGPFATHDEAWTFCHSDERIPHTTSSIFPLVPSVKG